MGSDAALLFLSIGLILTNAFFVAGEYALVSARKSRMEALARKGHRTAPLVLHAMDNMGPYVAGVQIAITMLNVAIGFVAEPFLTRGIERAFSGLIPPAILDRINDFLPIASLLVLTYLTVVIGELLPKYFTLQRAEGVALASIRGLRFSVKLLTPFVFVVQRSGNLLLKPFGIDIESHKDQVVPKDELMMLVRSGGSSGVLEQTHAEMVNRALRLDVLYARDIMVHRLDIKWLDTGWSKDELRQRLMDLPYNKLPVCRGDIDDLVGIAYLHDLFCHIDRPDFSLEEIARPPVAVPETLTLDRLVETMRTSKTQILVVMDEYGGTSGIITLEDVIEEIFGDLEDSLEESRSPLEVYPDGRISARADLRVDEVVDRMKLAVEDPSTDTLATVMVGALDRVPKIGDTVEFSLGRLRVDNMARRRITRVSLTLDPALVESQAESISSS
jgi:CBS domain containing-hemolysin-like protein